MDDYNHLDGIGSQEWAELFSDDSTQDLNHAISKRQSLNTQGSARQSFNPHHSIKEKAKRNSEAVTISRIKTSAIPGGSIFNFEYLNEIQSKSFDIVYNSNSNFLLVAPTGSGKTVIFELAILSLLQRNKSPKIVYIAPTKALCQEKYQDWNRRFDFQVSIITGDTTSSLNYNLLITTPEKFDSITRTNKTFFELVLVDEIHFVKDSSRGSCLEVLLTNIKSRIVAVSATISNINDMANWLKAKLLYFGQEYRPVQLEKHVYGYPVNQSLFAFEDGLKYKLMGLINSFWKGKPVLVFCCTRKSVVSTAEFIGEQTEMFKPCSNVGVADKKLGILLQKGIGFHHAGLCIQDRKIIEQLFLEGKLLCLFTTSTLAVGVNLPAHLVIIKGTLQYNFNTGKLDEYSDLDLLQMIGRAGRPQFDKSGTVVIMTTPGRKQYIENIVDGKDIIESSLHLNLIEYLNTQIFKQSIKDYDSAMDWLKSTFLYLRIQKNPGYYQFRKVDKQDGMKNAENRLEAIFQNELNKLVDAGLVKTIADRSIMSVTKYGEIMSRNYLKFQTVVNFKNLCNFTQIDAFHCLCKAQEFDEIRFYSDKTILNQINKLAGIKYPIKGRVIDLWQKVSLCLQVAIGNISLADMKSGTINSDITSIVSIAKRLSRGMKCILIEKGVVEGIVTACKLSQAISCQLWPTGQILKQVEGIGMQFSRKLEHSRINTFGQLRLQPTQDIERILGRNPPLGVKILAAVHKIPKPIVEIRSVDGYQIKLSLENPERAMKSIKSQPITFYLLIYSANRILKQANVNIDNLVAGYNVNVKGESITVELICNEIAGIDLYKQLSKPETSKFFKSKSIEFDGDDIWNSVNVEELMDFNHKSNDCNHKCADKSQCLHKCCKNGVSQKTLKKRQLSKELESLIDIDGSNSGNQAMATKNNQVECNNSNKYSWDKRMENAGKRKESALDSSKPATVEFSTNQQKPFTENTKKPKREILSFDHYIDEDIDMTLVDIDLAQPLNDAVSLASDQGCAFDMNDFGDVYDMELPQIELSASVEETYNKLHGIKPVPRSESTDPKTVPLLPSKEIGLKILKDEWNGHIDELSEDDNLEAIMNLF